MMSNFRWFDRAWLDLWFERNEPKKQRVGNIPMVKWLCKDLQVAVTAATKSKARAIIKREEGPIPVGTEIERME